MKKRWWKEEKETIECAKEKEKKKETSDALMFTVVASTYCINQ